MSRLRRIYEAFFLLVALANLLFVIFDFLYLTQVPYLRKTFRDIFLEHAPSIVAQYDPVKGIEAHRDTAALVAEYDELKTLLKENDPTQRLQIQTLTASIIERTEKMIDAYPSQFLTAEKDGDLETAKNNMRKHMNENSAKEAFRKFFDPTNLNADKYYSETDFFDKEVRVYLNQNYHRWISEDGQPKDFFFKYDRWFVLFFWLDFLFRWIMAIQGGQLRKWYLFPVRRWYELFNLFPPHHSALFRLLRVISFYLRLKDNRLIPGGGILPDIIHDNAGVIAEEISGMVMVNILKQSKGILKESDLSFVEDPALRKGLEKVLENQLERVGKQAIPKLEPAISALVIHSVHEALMPYLKSPIGPFLRFGLPALDSGIRDGLMAALSDEEGRKQMAMILRDSVQTVISELAQRENLRLMRDDLVVFLGALEQELENAISRKPH